MSSTENAKVVEIEIRRYNAESARHAFADVGRLYEDVYREPPYHEGPNDVADFVRGLPRRAEQPSFRLVLAISECKPVGFAFGHQLASGTKWWQGATTRLPDSIIHEHVGRTFAIIELAVQAGYRRRGIAKAMHDALLCDGTEERVTLLVRPEAVPARTAYEHWGYVRVGAIRPWANAPLYDAMVLDLSNR